MSVTVKKFSTYAFKVLAIFPDCTEKKRMAWTVPARYCFMPIINDSRNLFGNMAMKARRHMLSRENNVSFAQTSFPDSASERKDYQIIAIKTLRNIDVGKELFREYGYEKFLVTVNSVIVCDYKIIDVILCWLCFICLTF